MRPRQVRLFTGIIVLVIASLLSACGAASSPTPAATAPASSAAPTTQAQATQPAPTKASATSTALPPTPTTGPKVGGTFVYQVDRDIESLDPIRITGETIAMWYGASLVALAPDGQYVPYLASSWKVSDDGLVWDFTMKKNIKFSDGAPCTAKDYVWTIQRAKDPANKAGSIASGLAPVTAAEAPDDYTLRLTLSAPYFPFLQALASSGFMQPLEQAVVEKAGDQYGVTVCVGVGPFKFKEWRRGEKVVLERNPDFNWGPSFYHPGPFYIQTLECKIITEYSTAIAGLEAGEISSAIVQPQDIERIKATKKFTINEVPLAGCRPAIYFNNLLPSLSDVRVRQALNYAIDKASIIKAVEQGNGVPQYGPISQSVHGYWSGVEQIGYKFDLAKAKDLMKQAGYTAGSDGILRKDDKPLKLTIQVGMLGDYLVRVAQMIQAQYKALGVDTDIQQMEIGLWVSAAANGKCELALSGWDDPEINFLVMAFRSTSIGSLNIAQIKDPELDKLLDATRTTMDPAKRQEACNQVQKYMVEQAFIAPIYAPNTLYAFANNVKGAFRSPTSGLMYLGDAYFTDIK